MQKNRQLKLIWDFRGPDAELIAKHHEIHLKEFFQIEAKTHFGIGVETLTEMHSIAYVIVSETDMKPVRDALKPHRGVVHAVKH
jgi:hypothetical protein